MRWPRQRLELLASDEPYSFVGGPFGSKLTSRDYVDDGIPVIRGSNLNNGRYLGMDDFVFVSESKVRKDLSGNLAKALDLIFTQRGTLGQVALIPRDGISELYVVSQSQMKLTVDKTKADRLFLYYYFSSRDAVERIMSFTSSSGVPHINLAVLRSLEVPVPPLTTQRAVADVLSAYDDLIENNRRRMALLEESARLLYQEWFVRLRFPGHEHTRIIDGVPMGWKHRQLNEVAVINRESLRGTFDGAIDYVDISSVTPGLINETTKYSFQDAPSRARRVVRHGDLIWSCVRPNRRSYAVIWQPPPTLIVSTGFAVITPLLVPTSFLYQAVTTDQFVGYLENHARGAAYPAVVAGDFERAQILTPPKALVGMFDDIISPLLAQSNNLWQQNQKLRTTRDLLLPKLMSGEIAV